MDGWIYKQTLFHQQMFHTYINYMAKCMDFCLLSPRVSLTAVKPQLDYTLQHTEIVVLVDIDA